MTLEVLLRVVKDAWAGLHDDVQADLPPRCQKVSQPRATQPRGTGVPDRVAPSAAQPIFWNSDSFNFKCHGRQLAPNRCNLGGRSVWDVVVQPSPGFARRPQRLVLEVERFTDCGGSAACGKTSGLATGD